jgi:hypothetical protein
MTTFSIDELSEQRLEDALDDLSQLPRGDEVVTLELKGEPAFDPLGIGLLHGFFLANKRSLRITVSGHLAESFPSLGLASAISRRSYSVQPERLHSSEWARTWTPGSRHFAEALFASPTEADAEFALSGPSFATFNDPHVTHPLEGSSSLSALVRRWLYRRLEGEPARQLDQAVDQAGFFVSELVANVREHAVWDDRDPVKSQAWVRVWKQGEQPFFALCVSDSGPGIEKTLRDQLGEDAPAGEKLFQDLLEGSLPGFGRARGIGLARCAEIVERTPDAAMLIATGPYRCHGGGKERRPSVASAAAEILGTLVVVTLPV